MRLGIPMKSIPLCVAGALVFSLSVSTASAGDLIKCERRTNPARSKIRVEAENLLSGAMYSATVFSAGGSALAWGAADPAGKVHFEYDSNPNNILAGATAINANFVVNQASTTVTDAMGNPVASGSAACKVK